MSKRKHILLFCFVLFGGGGGGVARACVFACSLSARVRLGIESGIRIGVCVRIAKNTLCARVGPLTPACAHV